MQQRRRVSAQQREQEGWVACRKAISLQVGSWSLAFQTAFERPLGFTSNLWRGESQRSVEQPPLGETLNGFFCLGSSQRTALTLNKLPVHHIWFLLKAVSVLL